MQILASVGKATAIGRASLKPLEYRGLPMQTGQPFSAHLCVAERNENFFSTLSKAQRIIEARRQDCKIMRGRILVSVRSPQVSLQTGKGTRRLSKLRALRPFPLL
jgi:hypothetical protein